MSPEAQAKTEAGAQRLGEEMDFAEVRRALKLSQGEIRQRLELVGAVAKIENRADMYVSTLRRFVEAMGGELPARPGHYGLQQDNTGAAFRWSLVSNAA